MVVEIDTKMLDSGLCMVLDGGYFVMSPETLQLFAMDALRASIKNDEARDILIEVVMEEEMLNDRS